MDERQIAQVPMLVAQYQDSLRLTSSFNTSAKDRKLQKEIHAKLENRYDALLTPEQWVRLRQLMYQGLYSSDYLLDSPLVRPLQLDEIEKINERYLESWVQGLSDLKNPRAMQLRNDTMNQVFEVLTPEQQEQFRQLAGGPVDRDILHLQMQQAGTWHVEAVPSSFSTVPAEP